MSLVTYPKTWPCEVIGNATLYLGDCLEILPTLDRVDAVVTDPPYGINHFTHGQVFKNSNPISGDENHEAYMWLDSLNVPLIAFYSPFKPPPIVWSSVLCWAKGPHVGGGGDIKSCWKRDIEMIGAKRTGPLNGQRDSALIQINALVEKPTGHFCEKPVGIMTYLISKIASEVIIDPFMGSGTTGVACANLERRFIGIEQDPKYFGVACERIGQAQKQGKLFS